jgi:putative endonuclease
MSVQKSSNPPTTRQRGDRAEQIAAEHLCRLGYRIVERNFSCKLGEVDIIAAHQGELVFVEVRSRHSSRALDPVYTLGPRKQTRIIRAAQVYLSGQRFKKSPPARFDVVLVTLDEPPIVELLRDAFSMQSSEDRGRSSRCW